MDDKNTIKAIETEYHGCKFRSRLEARWAVFFDTVGVKWEYEPEGFDLGDGIRYLPDFLLHGVEGRGADENGDLYVEVKGVLNDDDRIKIDRFSIPCQRPLLVVGSIPKTTRNWLALEDDALNGLDCDYFYNLQFCDADYYHAIPAVNKNGNFALFGADWNWDDYDFEATLNAYKKASMARFENSSPITKQQYASKKADILENTSYAERMKLRSKKNWVRIPHAWADFLKQEEPELVKKIILSIFEYDETGDALECFAKLDNAKTITIFSAFIVPELDKQFDDYVFKANK